MKDVKGCNTSNKKEGEKKDRSDRCRISENIHYTQHTFTT